MNDDLFDQKPSYIEQTSNFEKEYSEGIFLYEVTCNSLKMVQEFLYAKKDYSTLDIKAINSMNKQPEKIKVFVEREIESC